MVLDLASPPTALTQPITHDVRQIADTQIVRDILHNVQRVVFHDDEEESQRHIESFVASIEQSPDQIVFYAAYVNEIPVSAAWITFAQESSFAGLWAGATLEGYRGRGLYTALLAVRAQEAIRRECRFLYIDASPMSRPIVAKHGFFALATTIECQWKHQES
jgi:GNAT superfamily N-acetyltransferase